ncbi:MAG: hypothetical protein WCL07_01515 [bacterium]
MDLKKQVQPTLLGDILNKYQIKKDGKYISQEFQDYGYRLAIDLDDMAHKALYIRLAKTTPRATLETARSYVVDALNARNKGRMFMWKLMELKKNIRKDSCIVKV